MPCAWTIAAAPVRRQVVGRLYRSRTVLSRHYRITAIRSRSITRSLVSAVGSLSSTNYLTTGRVNIAGGIYICLSSTNRSRILCGPHLIFNLNTDGVRRDYLARRRVAGSAHCVGYGITFSRVISNGVHRHGRSFINFRTRVIRRVVSRYRNGLI